MAFFNLFVFIFPFSLGVALISEERHRIAYFFTRPIPRFAWLCAEHLAISSLSSLVICLLFLIFLFGSYFSNPMFLVASFGISLRVMISLFFLAFCYTWIPLIFGVALGESGRFLSLIYFVIFEFGFGAMPFAFRFISIGFWAQRLAGIELGGWMPETVPEVGPGLALFVLFLFFLIFGSFGAALVSISECQMDKG
ncbi:MAG: hypothetical protein NZM37_08265 [Sandaracinaceae bacterium]|nr:hypothetical protein [Sandaracinaceae bacterium]MDW8246584.1 hypothetical protein [Sandaracinaceae bacterium]